jgi:hypothetical protein
MRQQDGFIIAIDPASERAAGGMGARALQHLGCDVRLDASWRTRGLPVGHRCSHWERKKDAR